MIAMALPSKLAKWAEQPGSVITSAEVVFIDAMRRAAASGVGFGFMQQVIEWEWQDVAARQGTPSAAWGPEYHGLRIAELEAELAEWRAHVCVPNQT